MAPPPSSAIAWNIPVASPAMLPAPATTPSNSAGAPATASSASPPTAPPAETKPSPTTPNASGAPTTASPTTPPTASPAAPRLSRTAPTAWPSTSAELPMSTPSVTDPAHSYASPIASVGIRPSTPARMSPFGTNSAKLTPASKSEGESMSWFSESLMKIAVAAAMPAAVATASAGQAYTAMGLRPRFCFASSSCFAASEGSSGGNRAEPLDCNKGTILSRLVHPGTCSGMPNACSCQGPLDTR
mmetsp:Transcript_25149/g.63790  ORF Transcript_25149/g.63790 Transcript_25149/m.63790 type:complete len:244 (-) Transcript_25149:1017-1748(-)